MYIYIYINIIVSAICHGYAKLFFYSGYEFASGRWGRTSCTNSRPLQPLKLAYDLFGGHSDCNKRPKEIWDLCAMSSNNLFTNICLYTNKYIYIYTHTYYYLHIYLFPQNISQSCQLPKKRGPCVLVHYLLGPLVFSLSSWGFQT